MTGNRQPANDKFVAVEPISRYRAIERIRALAQIPGYDKNPPDWRIRYLRYGVPEGIRTPDRTLRRRMLYPAELLGQVP